MTGDATILAQDVSFTFGAEDDRHFQIGQRPYQMGNEAPDILIQLINGETVEDPKFTGLDLCTIREPGICESSPYQE